MYEFKTNLFESQHRQSMIGRVSRALGFSNKGDHAEDNSGHSIHIHDGYFHLYHGDEHTGVSAAHHDNEDGFVNKVRRYFASKK